MTLKFDSDAPHSDDSSPISSESPIPGILTTLFVGQGLEEREWGSKLAEIIGGSYSKAQRRLANQDQLTIAELRAIAQHFRTNMTLLLQAVYSEERKNPQARSAILKLGDRRMPCSVLTRPVIRLSAEALLAYESADGQLLVAPQGEAAAGCELQAVHSIDIPAPPAFRIAVLDDSASAVIPVVRLLNGRGFETTGCTSASQVQALLSLPNRPHGYILDWTLEEGQNSMGLIEQIRRVDPQCPIFLLTGTIQTNEGEISHAVEMYRVQVHLKPARAGILAASLRSLLENDGQEPIPFIHP